MTSKTMNRRSPKQVPADHCFGETAPALPLQVLQVLYSIRSERLLVEQLTYNLLFRWFIGLNMDEEVGADGVQQEPGSSAGR